jgi:hypothetical protein
MNRDYKGLLVSFVEIVVFLFAAFGGFLKSIAPPEQSGAPYIVGILSFLALIALLIVAAVARSVPGDRYRRGWILAGVIAFATALPASYFYPQSLSRYTWWYPPDKPVQRLRALDKDFTQPVKDFLKDKPESEKRLERLARNFELYDIWTQESIEHAASKLTELYAWLVLSLASAVFCLLEANSSANRSPVEISQTSSTDGSEKNEAAEKSDIEQTQADSAGVDTAARP